MSGEIEVYTFENAKGEEATGYTTMNPKEAKEHGQKYGLRVIAQQYTWEDSDLAWDFTGIEKEDDDG